MQRAEFYVEGGGGGGGGTEGFGGCAESCLTETAMNKDAAIKTIIPDMPSTRKPKNIIHRVAIIDPV